MGSTLAPAVHTPRRSSAVLALLRPRQWIKNLLVGAAPLAAGAVTDPSVVAATTVAFVAFTLAAAGTYALNDVADRDTDARHPHKRHRPVAAGLVSPRHATVIGAGLLTASVALPLGLSMAPLALVVAAYVALTTAYSRWLKRVALFDIAAITGGFLLRAVAGAVGSNLPMSRWFLVVAGFAALYVVANKRAAEHRTAAPATTRAALVGYTTELLREIRFIAAAVTIGGYVSWAFSERAASLGSQPWAALSIAPFVLGVFRYAAAVDAGLGEAPEEILLRDRVLQGVGAVWLAIFVVAVYVG